MMVIPLLSLADLDPGDAGWGDVLFVTLWAVGSLILAAYYCYRAFFTSS
ncbi:MAG TPA: hypothetical protein VE219_06285 [Candidatus Sulfotelmatobacter sp.]|jgi:hypothetical protein|nr:hypothetical protein [Candidatus Sulfotelmatobacter sp.]